MINKIWQKYKKEIPKSPGIYIYKNKSKEIIYVGKAINLYHRIYSYFSSKVSDPKTQTLINNIEYIETIKVRSEIEALILEANLIKKNKPKFNISFWMIKIIYILKSLKINILKY